MEIAHPGASDRIGIADFELDGSDPALLDQSFSAVQHVQLASLNIDLHKLDLREVARGGKLVDGDDVYVMH